MSLATAAAMAAAALSFQVREGGNVNLFYQSPAAAYQLRLANPANPRLLVAFPAGNAGVLLSFAEHGLTWTPGTWGEWDGPDGLRGAEAELTADRSSVTITAAILDSMRLIRDAPLYPREVEDRRALARSLDLDSGGWADADASVNGSTLTLTRRTLDGKNHYRVELAFASGTRLDRGGGGLWTIRDPSGRPLRLTLRAGVDYAPLTPLSAAELLAPAALAAYRSAPEGSPLRQSVDRLRFLIYEEKMLAGSHRFLTYFGRDTMLTTLLAWDSLAVAPREAALRSVLDRLSPDGIVAHEEDIGGQAERRRVHDALSRLDAGDKAGARAALQDLQAPLYDYKMIDGEPLLALLAHRYLTDPALPSQRRATLLERYRPALQRALRRLTQEALPYARDPRPTNLVALRHPTVGDWRDSDEGNAFGRFPGSVDAYLIPAALAALPETAAAAGIEPRSLCDVPLADLAKAWSHARAAFEVSLTAREARRLLTAFLARAPENERPYYEKRLGPLDRIGPVRFTALSLDAEGRPIPVMSSDGVLDLLLGRPSRAERGEDLAALTRPYPLGLATEAGVVAANAAFSGRPKDAQMFSRTDYHGAVVWGWQQTALIEGARRAGASGAAAAAQAERAVGGAGDLARLELWTFDPRPDGAVAAPFNLGSGTDNEANPVQMWSSVMALGSPRPQR